MARSAARDPRGSDPPDPTLGTDAELELPLDEHVRIAVATWPQIDPVVEGIVSRVDKANRTINKAARATLARVGLNREEFKVLMALHGGPRSHGWLSNDLDVSTGAMTNRLDKLERGGLVSRSRDPNDRRGVLLELTDAGHQKLDAYIELGANRERQLLEGLSDEEKDELDALLRKLLVSLQDQTGP